MLALERACGDMGRAVCAAEFRENSTSFTAHARADDIKWHDKVAGLLNMISTHTKDEAFKADTLILAAQSQNTRGHRGKFNQKLAAKAGSAAKGIRQKWKADMYEKISKTNVTVADMVSPGQVAIAAADAARRFALHPGFLVATAMDLRLLGSGANARADLESVASATDQFLGKNAHAIIAQVVVTSIRSAFNQRDPPVELNQEQINNLKRVAEEQAGIIVRRTTSLVVVDAAASADVAVTTATTATPPTIDASVQIRRQPTPE